MTFSNEELKIIFDALIEYQISLSEFNPNIFLNKEVVKSVLREKVLLQEIINKFNSHAN